MFKDIEEAKSFVEWAKSQQIKRVELGELKVEFSDLAFIDLKSLEQPLPISKEAQKIVEAAQAKEDDDLLYWSAK